MEKAAESGLVSLLFLLLTSGKIDDVPSQTFMVCFRRAIIGGYTELVQFMLVRDPERYHAELLESAFVVAAQMNHCSILLLLVDKVQNRASYRVTLSLALNAACTAGAMSSVQWLIDAGADVNAIAPGDFSGLPNSPFRFRLLPNRPPIGRYYQVEETPLGVCLRYIQESIGGYYYLAKQQTILQLQEISKLLLQHGANVNQLIGGEYTPLHIAARCCSEELVRMLIAKGADVNAITSQGTPLHSALQRELEPLPIVRALLESGGVIGWQDDANDREATALSTVLNHFGPDPSHSHNMRTGWASCHDLFRRSSSMMDVLSTGPGAVIKVLLLSCPKLCATDQRFGLLLQMIAVADDVEYLQLLIERGADVNICGHYYGCALQAAARFGHLECVHLLLNAGAKVNLTGGRYETALRAAVIGEHETVVSTLNAHGANVNLQLVDEE